MQNRIKQTVRPEDTIMGPQTYWFGLYDHDYYSWEQLVYYRRYLPDSTLEDALREFRPDILIIDQGMEYYISDTVLKSTHSEARRLPRTEMESFLSRYAELIAVLGEDDDHKVQVYRIEWPMEEPEGHSPNGAKVPVAHRGYRTDGDSSLSPPSVHKSP
jgi:hypothetical protein